MEPTRRLAQTQQFQGRTGTKTGYEKLRYYEKQFQIMPHVADLFADSLAALHTQETKTDEAEARRRLTEFDQVPVTTPVKRTYVTGVTQTPRKKPVSQERINVYKALKFDLPRATGVGGRATGVGVGSNESATQQGSICEIF